MKRLLMGLALALLAASPAAADSVSSRYDDAVQEAEAGANRLKDADWQFRDGNPREGCALMEQARVHYEQAYRDMQAMDQMVNDPAGGYGADDRERTMSWIHQQQETLNPIAAKMADTYHSTCQ
ncbi:MAG: hypothetical protein JWP35_3665 [Caulobacter sp.]|nr:hypothetical protein [Caulobacter sp.]